MNSTEAVATKQDIQMIFEAIQTMGIEFRNEMDERFEKFEKKMDEKMDKKNEEIKRHMGVLIEDLEERFLETSKDTLDMHTDKLENHEERIDHLENVRLVA